MTISVGAATQGAGSTGGSSLDIGALAPDAGDNKRVIAVGFRHGTVAGSPDAMSATFGGAAMTKIVETDDPSDPRRILAVFEHKIGASTAPGNVVFNTTNSDRWSGVAFVLIDVPDAAVPETATSTTLAALALDFAHAGVLLDVAAVNTDDSSNTDNVITIDAAQTLIRQQNRGVGSNTEGRLTTSYKTVSAGTRSGASSSPHSDGVVHIVVGYEEAGDAGAVLSPVGATHAESAQAPPLQVRLGPASALHAATATSAPLRPRLGAANAAHGHGVSSPALTLAGQLGAASARHAHAARAAPLESAGVAGPQGVFLPHAASSPVLSTAFVPPGINGPVLKIGADGRGVCIRPDARVLNVHAA